MAFRATWSDCPDLEKLWSRSHNFKEIENGINSSPCLASYWDAGKTEAALNQNPVARSLAINWQQRTMPYISLVNLCTDLLY